ncbi:hypothetical protein CU098_004045, partial [Rhizopus stolonifer]
TLDKEHVQQLLALFPKGDPEYFYACLQYYKQDPVERITEKILDRGGYYPQLPVQKKGDNRLNACLSILALDLFPDCDVSYLRERVLQYSYAHIEQVVDAILSTGKYPERLEYGKMDPSEGIRSEKYKSQAQLQLIQDYPQIWKSSVRAVLAENNWDYIKCYDHLKEMGSNGFWNTIRNFFFYWSSTPSHHTKLTVTDPDLLDQLNQLQQHAVRKQVEKDRQLAVQLNLTEYTDQQQLITCDCCYSDESFEQLVFCSEGQHAFCHRCVTHYMSEGLFGQGTLRSQPRIHCISMDECTGYFGQNTLRHLLSDDIWKAYESSLLEEGVRAEQQVLCCACPYFELDESTKPLEWVYTNRVLKTMARWMMWDIQQDLEIAYGRVTKSRRGSLFQCKNPTCKTLTCLTCRRPVRGAHTCWEKESDGLRLYVEKAMADAVKRTCPNCFLSFQKSDGCNKIACPCGYKMCYVCRKDIGKESYDHFCSHFRAIPGSKCNACNKCDLYKTEPENEAVQKAADRAKRQYIQAHPEIASSDMLIGPASAMDKLGDWKQQTTLWILEKGLNLIV